VAEPATLGSIAALDAVREQTGAVGLMHGPRGGRPRRWLTASNVALYGTLVVISIYFLVPLYVMIVTSLKDMDEVRQGNIFSLPQEITFYPWIKAWAEACTGINCDGLSRGFWNSVIILVPSVIVSIAVASVSGYLLANWRFPRLRSLLHYPHPRRLHPLPGDDLPYRHPARADRPLRLALGAGGGAHHLWDAHQRAAVPQLLRLHPPGALQGCAGGRGGLLGIFFRIMLPMSLPIFVVSMILQVTGIWNDFLFGVIYVSNERYPMTVQLNNIVNSVQGVKEYNVNMAATLLTGLVPLAVYFASGKLFVRGIARARSRADGERLIPCSPPTIPSRSAASTSPSARCACSRTSTSTSPKGSSWCCWAPRAAASPRC
jgi:glucose/mannose transport system permease protein